MAFLDNEGVSYLWSKIKTALGKKLDSDGKATSATTADTAKSVPWSGVSGTPTTVAGYKITDAYTKTEVDSKVSTAKTEAATDATTKANKALEDAKTYTTQQIANAPHLKRSIVTSPPVASAADANTIYMVKDSSATGADKYKEYMLIDGAVVQTGDTSVDLTNYALKSSIPTVNNSKITIKQNGNIKGTFTANQNSDVIVELTDNNTTYTAITTAELDEICI